MSVPGPHGAPSTKGPPASGAGATTVKELFGYNVHSRLGVGARSIVYLVSDPATQQRYALKRIVREEPELDDPAIEQMKNEYEIGRRLSHVNLRKCLQLFVTKKLFLFGIREVALLMELVDGMSLLDKRNYSLAVLADIFRQTAEGLNAMHQTGFVHADMKPHNIVVSDARLVKLVDYGQSCPNGTVKTRIQGTPEFIAPEQVKRGPIDPRTDVYNLGTTMYWVLTGKHLPSPLEVYKNLQAGVLTALPSSISPPSAINPRVLPEWDTLVMKCIKHDKKERPADMAIVASRLQTILDEYLARDPKALDARKREPTATKSISSSGSSEEIATTDIDTLDRELEAKLNRPKRVSREQIEVGLEDSIVGVIPVGEPPMPQAAPKKASTAARSSISGTSSLSTSTDAASRSRTPAVPAKPIRPSLASSPDANPTLPSTTLPSTTLPSTTLPSTTLPSTTLLSTTLPSTTLPSSTLPPRKTPPKP